MARLFDCVVLCGLIFCLSAAGLCAAEYHVNHNGTGDFEAIQDAIDGAVDGDVVIVHPGTYHENIHFDGKNIVLRSTDPENNHIVASTVIDGSQNGTTVMFAGTENDTCLLSGLTITNGESYDVGGISGNAALAAISYCTISANVGRYGGGVDDCDGSIANCAITGNTAMEGGGLYDCDGAITDCTVTDNSTTDSYGGGLGDCNGVISNCTISGNSAAGYGGGIGCCGGSITNCAVSGNSADYGGGLAYCGEAITGCTITGNAGTSYGGGLFQCDGALTNCIVWRNEAPEDPELRECTTTVAHCCIRNWTGGGEGNISSDPLFTEGPLGDYYLSCRDAGQNSNSPCIDAGNDTASSLGLDRRATRTDNVRDTGVVDMGYHYLIQPTIHCSLNAAHFSPGDLLTASVEAQNQGNAVSVDVYIGFILPDGTIFCYVGTGLVGGIVPWFEAISLPAGFHYGPAEVLRLNVPGGLPAGDYLFGAALSKPGRVEFIGQPSLFPFNITE